MSLAFAAPEWYNGRMNAELPRLLEFAMLFCFGFSWPFAIVRTFRAKRVDGKSPAFEVIVIVGYLFGVASHLLGDRSWVVWVYLADIALVTTDLSLYFRYRWHAGGTGGTT